MDTVKANVLFVEDNEACLRSTIRGVQCRTDMCICHPATSAEQALKIATQLKPEVIVMDLSLGEGTSTESGIQLITQFLGVAAPVRIIVLTGHTATDCGVRCIEAGAASFLSKPAEPEHLTALISDGINVTRLLRNDDHKTAEMMTSIAALGLSTRSKRMMSVLQEIAFVSQTSQPVLLCGETGVGKGVIAHAIHRASKRADKSFVRMQARFGSPDLASSELFGHTRGAFTGATDARSGIVEEADGGTLFLDEIDTLPKETQIELLNVLQEKVYQRLGSTKNYRSDFRLIAATNTAFDTLESDKHLRSDFYHRIAHSVIHIPPLRERRADIPQLAQYFINRLEAEDRDSPVCGISGDALAWLYGQDWKGNIRELKAVVERGYLHANFCHRTLISIADLKAPASQTPVQTDTTLSRQLRSYELSITAAEFAKHSQNYTQTARALGIDRKRLRRILAQTTE